MRRIWRKVRKVFMGAVIGMLSLIICFGVFLVYLNESGKVTYYVKSFLNKHIDGTLKLEKIRFGFSQWPYVEVFAVKGLLTTASDIYPSDTLCCFDTIDVLINLPDIIRKNYIHIPSVCASNPLAYVFLDEKGNSNWSIWDFTDIFPRKNTGKSRLKLNIQHIEIADTSRFRYDNRHSGMRISSHTSDLDFEGRIAINYKNLIFDKIRIRNFSGSLFVPGLPLNLNFRQDYLALKSHDEEARRIYELQFQAVESSLSIKKYEYLKNTDLDFSGIIAISKDYMEYEFCDVGLSWNDNHIALDGLYMHPCEKDSIAELDLDFKIRTGNVNQLIESYPYDKSFISAFDMDFPFLAEGKAEGGLSFSDGLFPQFNVSAIIPKGNFSYKNYHLKHLKADLEFNYLNNDNSQIQIEKLDFMSDNSRINLEGRVSNLTKNPSYNLDIDADLDLNSFNRYFDRNILSSIYGHGVAKFSFSALQSDIVNMKLNNMMFSGCLTLDNSLAMFRDTSAVFSCGKFNMIFANEPHSNYCGLRGGGNMPELRFSGRFIETRLKSDFNLSADSVSGEVCMSDLDSLLNILNSNISLYNFKGYAENGDSVRAQSLETTLFLKDPFRKDTYSSLDLTTRGRNILVSGHSLKLASEGLGVILKAGRRLSSTNHITDWEYAGALLMDSSQVYTPFLPLPNKVENFELLFSPDLFRIKNLRLESGNSNLSIDGKVENWQDYLLKKDTLKGLFNVESTYLDLDQLVPAMIRGFVLLENRKAEDVSSVLGKQPDIDVISDKSRLISIPPDLNFKVNLYADSINYNGLHNLQSNGEIFVADSKLLLNDFQLFSENAGAVCLDFGYSCRMKTLAKTWLNFSISDLDVAQLMLNVPDIGKLLPILETMEGKVNCEVVGSAVLDSMMRVRMPTLYVLSRINGSDLSIDKENILPDFLATLLLGKKPQIRLDSVSVDIEVRDSIISVYPFIANIGRFQFSASGLQNLDNTYFFHISLLKWPLWFKLGFNIYGKSGDMKFRFACPKLTNLSLPAKILSTSTTRLYPSNNLQNNFSHSLLEQQEAFESINSYYNSLYYNAADSNRNDGLSQHLKEVGNEVKALLENK